MSNWGWGVFLVVVTLLGLTACGFGHKNFNQQDGVLVEPESFVLQIDDYGKFWDPGIPSRALETIEREAEKSNTVVVLYIHGWHHNAQVKDDNVDDFATSLKDVRSKLNDLDEHGNAGPYRQSREYLTSHGDIKVIGIYVGWRGKSLPMPLDYLTFWGRKAAAERVGEGDLREFLVRLNKIYRERNKARSASKSVPFMGMVSFGHSFGGQVLFKAVHEEFERQLFDVTDLSASTGKIKLDRPLYGFGDLVVLVNPAFEALQYEKIHSLSGRLKYDRTQTPLLLILSSATDGARKVFFPMGRNLASIFRASPPDTVQKKLWTKAVGEYIPQRTHSVDLISDDDARTHRFDPNDYVNDRCKILNLDFANMPYIGSVKLVPTGNQVQPYSPFMVAYASGDVIIRHSGIFKERLRYFLNDYIALVEGKRMVLSAPEVQECQVAAK